MNPLLGVVMCGGKSERMGSDKGLLRTGAMTWAESAYQRLNAVCDQVIVSVNETQYSQYNNLFSSHQLVTDHPDVSIKGPMAGLLSVHKQHPSSDLLILACDLTELTTDTLEELITLYQEHKSTADFVVFSIEGEMEPLAGIYNAEGLSHIEELYRQGQLLKYSMKFCLEHSRTYIEELPVSRREEFKNFNTRESIG